jgi:hypothetical protein
MSRQHIYIYTVQNVQQLVYVSRGDAASIVQTLYLKHFPKVPQLIMEGYS